MQQRLAGPIDEEFVGLCRADYKLAINFIAAVIGFLTIIAERCPFRTNETVCFARLHVDLHALL